MLFDLRQRERLRHRNKLVAFRRDERSDFGQRRPQQHGGNARDPRNQHRYRNSKDHKQHAGSGQHKIQSAMRVSAPGGNSLEDFAGLLPVFPHHHIHQHQPEQKGRHGIQGGKKSERIRKPDRRPDKKKQRNFRQDAFERKRAGHRKNRIERSEYRGGHSKNRQTAPPAQEQKRQRLHQFCFKRAGIQLLLFGVIKMRK